MDHLSETFPDDLPRPKKRTHQESDPAVQPPDESALLVDDLLGMAPPSPAANLDVSLSPPAELDLDVSVDSNGPVTGYSSDLDLILSEPGSTPEAGAEGAHGYSPVGDLSPPLELVASDDDETVVDLPSAAKSAQSDEAPQSLLQKHKGKLIIAGVVAALIGLKQYQAGKEVAPQQNYVDPASIQVQEAAIYDMVTGREDISPLPDPGAVPQSSDEEIASLFGDAVISGAPVGGESPDPLTPVSEPPVAAPVTPVAPVAPVTPLVAGEISSAASSSFAAEPPAATTGAAESDQLAQLRAELAAVRGQLEAAQKEAATLKSVAAQKTAPTQAVQPARAEPKRETPRTSARPAAQPAPARQAQAVRAPASTSPVASKRSDIQYIGSFLRGNQWGAHVVIAGNLYELSAGQRIAGLKVDEVTGSGVSINGINYQ